ncbi:hypothetical protein [Shewanella xiamenensis]|nr:hypothetical protein [Shewanella xiamenensis]
MRWGHTSERGAWALSALNAIALNGSLTAEVNQSRGASPNTR